MLIDTKGGLGEDTLMDKGIWTKVQNLGIYLILEDLRERWVMMVSSVQIRDMLSGGGVLEYSTQWP